MDFRLRKLEREARYDIDALNRLNCLTNKHAWLVKQYPSHPTEVRLKCNHCGISDIVPATQSIIAPSGTLEELAIYYEEVFRIGDLINDICFTLARPWPGRPKPATTFSSINPYHAQSWNLSVGVMQYYTSPYFLVTPLGGLRFHSTGGGEVEWLPLLAKELGLTPIAGEIRNGEFSSIYGAMGEYGPAWSINSTTQGHLLPIIPNNFVFGPTSLTTPTNYDYDIANQLIKQLGIEDRIAECI